MHRCLILFALCSSSGAVAAQQSVLFTLNGDSAGDRLGSSLSRLDDVDGDGVPDFAVGSPGDSIRHVRVFSGATGDYLQSLTGNSPGDGFGSALAPVADVDGDGARELAVAAPLGGYVSLHSMGQGGAVLWTWSGPVTLVADAGDVDGDGTPDVVALASAFPASQVTVLSGLDGSVVRSFTAPGEWRFLDAGGDADGDGAGDVLLGNPFWPNHDYPAATGGKVELYSGASGQLLQSHVGQPVFGLWLGWGVALLGDVDQDGRADYAAGWPWDMPLADPGHVQVRSGATGALITTIAQGLGSWGLGAGVFAAGDVDGDGRGDLGIVDENGGSKTLSVRSSSNWATLFSLSVPSAFGFADADICRLAVLGDLDSDANLELLVGYPSASPEGHAIVVTPCEVPANYCIAAPNSLSPNGSQIGWSGSTSVAANQFTLTAVSAPPGELAMFIYSASPAQLPFGNGFLCLGASTGIFRILPAQTVVPFNTCPIDFTAPQFSQGAGALLPGATWHFQFWYRDTASGGANFNLSDGLRVTFCP